MTKQITRKEIDTQKLKEEIEVIKRSVMLSKQDQDLSRKNMEELQKSCSTVKDKHQIACLTSKTLEHIMDRMRKDEYLHQLRIS